jgi:hypothetical protein
MQPSKIAKRKRIPATGQLHVRIFYRATNPDMKNRTILNPERDFMKQPLWILFSHRWSAIAERALTET